MQTAKNFNFRDFRRRLLLLLRRMLMAEAAPCVGLSSVGVWPRGYIIRANIFPYLLVYRPLTCSIWYANHTEVRSKSYHVAICTLGNRLG